MRAPRANDLRGRRYNFRYSSASCLCGLRPIWAHGRHKDYDKIDVKEVQHDG
jgi:hypothetical protein